MESSNANAKLLKRNKRIQLKSPRKGAFLIQSGINFQIRLIFTKNLQKYNNNINIK